jgi:purine-binding chemotaxis protein CheW
MSESIHYIVFIIEDKSFALPMENVERVVHAVEVTLLPKVPAIVRGIINYKSIILPVIDIRSRFHLPEIEIHLNHQFIITRTTRGLIALLADNVTGVIEKSTTDIIPPFSLIGGVEFLKGILKLDDGMMLVPDIDKILTPKESRALTEAMKKAVK